MELSAVQQRVVGSLIEKELAHPDSYPLSMNALQLACNQLTNRDPVMELDLPTLENTLHNLRSLGVVRMVTGARVDKFRHVLDDHLDLSKPEAAVVSLLLLRGPQTAAELRGRSARLHAFAGGDELDRTLQGLAERSEPIVELLDRQRGEKAQRWAHRLGAPEASHALVVAHTDVAHTDVGAQDGRVRELEAEVQRLREEVSSLRAELDRLTFT
ncbi:MAG: YceH family protein [Mycobacteriales bacterium]